MERIEHESNRGAFLMAFFLVAVLPLLLLIVSLCTPGDVINNAINTEVWTGLHASAFLFSLIQGGLAGLLLLRHRDILAVGPSLAYAACTGMATLGLLWRLWDAVLIV